MAELNYYVVLDTSTKLHRYIIFIVSLKVTVL